MMKVVKTVLRLTNYLIFKILSTISNFVFSNQTEIQKICYNHVKTLAFHEVKIRGPQSLAFTL